MLVTITNKKNKKKHRAYIKDERQTFSMKNYKTSNYKITGFKTKKLVKVKSIELN